MTRLFTLNGRPWFSSKPSKKVLAAEIDRLNAALSNAGNIQAKTEKLWTMAEENVTVLGRSLARANQKLEKYDESALAEARRLAVLQIFGGYAHNLNEAAEWLATGTWTATEAMADFEFRSVDRILSGDDEPDVKMVSVEGEEYQQAMKANYQNGFAAGREEMYVAPVPVGSAQSNAYAHGWVKGWNELLDKIQARLNDSTQPQPDDQFEHLRHSFKRTEAM